MENQSIQRCRSRYLNLILFNLALSLAIVAVSPREAEAQTGFGCLPQPIDFSTISEYQNPGPIWAVLCPGPPDPICTQAAAPQVEYVLQPGTYDQFLVHEAKIRATIPAEGSVPFTEMEIKGEVRDNSSSPWQDLWLDAGVTKVVTADALLTANRVAGGTQAVYGATGLSMAKQHRFRVSFCRNDSMGVRGCTCWSAWSGTFTPNTAYPGNLLPPSLIVERFQDDFERRESAPHRSRTGLAVVPRGDGMGATSVWTDERAGGSSAGNGSQIEIENGVSFLWMPENGFFAYAGPEALNTHTWAEIVLRPLSSDLKCNGNDTTDPEPPEHNRNYRVDLSVRASVSTVGQLVLPSNYMVQLVSEPDWDGTEDTLITEPTLRVFRTVNGVGAELDNRTLADLADDSTSDDCKELNTFLQPIYTACPTTTDSTVSGGAATLRIEVKNDTDLKKPLVTATILWNCSSTSCANSCSITAIDSGVNEQHALYLTKGHMSVTSHHWDTRLDRVRFGSANPAP